MTNTQMTVIYIKIYRKVYKKDVRKANPSPCTTTASIKEILY